MDCKAKGSTLLFPNSRLGMSLRARLCFAQMGVRVLAAHRTRRQSIPACETEFRSQVRSQTEFGSEGVTAVGLPSIPGTPQDCVESHQIAGFDMGFILDTIRAS